MVDPVRFKYIEGQAGVKWSEDGGVRGSREDTLTSFNALALTTKRGHHGLWYA